MNYCRKKKQIKKGVMGQGWRMIKFQIKRLPSKTETKIGIRWEGELKTMFILSMRKPLFDAAFKTMQQLNLSYPWET